MKLLYGNYDKKLNTSQKVSLPILFIINLFSLNFDINMTVTLIWQQINSTIQTADKLLLCYMLSVLNRRICSWYSVYTKTIYFWVLSQGPQTLAIWWITFSLILTDWENWNWIFYYIVSLVSIVTVENPKLTWTRLYYVF